MSNKKILIVDYTIAYLYSNMTEYPGGAAVEWYHWIKGFNENNVRIGILTLKGTSKIITKELDFDLIETWGMNEGIRKLKLLYPIFPRFYKAIKEYGPDFLVQETARRETFIFSIISKLLGKKFVHRIASDQDVDERLKKSISFFHRLLYHLGLKLSDIIFCQNQYQEQKLKKRFKNKKIFLLNTPFSLAVDKKITEKSQRSYIAWIGTFRSVKNIPALLKVVETLPELKFKIAGGKIIKGFSDNQTKVAVNQLESMNNVEFLEYMDYKEIPKFLGGAYALLNTSIAEGFSNTFLESWSVGTPIVSTKNVNPNNLIDTLNLGIVTESYDGLSAALLKIVGMSNYEYHNLSERCINYIRENHNAKILASKFLSYASD